VPRLGARRPEEVAGLFLALGLAGENQYGNVASVSHPSVLRRDVDEVERRISAKGEEWLSTGPHIMILVPGKVDASRFPTDHHSGEPWLI
jgi:hypothetical protein